MIAPMTMHRATFAAAGLRMTHLAMCAALAARTMHRATCAALTIPLDKFAAETAPTMPAVAGSRFNAE